KVGKRPVQGRARCRGIGVTRRCRVQDAPTVRSAVPAADALGVTRQFTVVIRAEDVDCIGQSGRRIDILVVPTLPRAEVVGRVVGAGGGVGGQFLPAIEEGGEGLAGGGGRGRSCRWRGERGRGRLVCVVRTPEVRGGRTGGFAAGGTRRAVGQVNPRHPVLDS